MKKLNVNVSHHQYDILIEQGLFYQVTDYLLPHCHGQKIVVITDNNVDSYYGEPLVKLLSRHYQVLKIVLPAGETTKNFQQLLSIYQQLTTFQLTRSDAILAMGGGVVGDIAGFVAATYLRGIQFIQMPTTLLAQVDSSVGGKVGIDLPQGKNLIGAFYQPTIVLIDPLMLETLTDYYFNDGMAEVIKYGCILDQQLFEQLEQLNSRSLIMTQIDDIIWRCCDLKRQVVEQDEKDKGERLKLNYGHTFGHALEAATHYQQYSHGQAIAIGMQIINNLTPQLSQAASQRVKQLLVDFHLPVNYTEDDLALIKPYIINDKKILGQQLHLIKLQQIGHSYIEKVALSELMKQLEK